MTIVHAQAAAFQEIETGLLNSHWPEQLASPLDLRFRLQCEQLKGNRLLSDETLCSYVTFDHRYIISSIADG